MKHIPLMVSAAMLLLSACSSTKQNDGSAAQTQDTTISLADSTSQQLTVRMQVKPLIKFGDSVMMTFTVYNNTTKDQTFCKWHTPFEPPMSMYLDVVDEKGNQAQYLGIMAKRVMPPPADTYLTVKAGDRLTASVDLRKSYSFDQPGKYSLKYNSEGISGLSVKDSVSFEYR